MDPRERTGTQYMGKPPRRLKSDLRFTVRTCVEVAKYVGVFFELQNEIKTLQMQIAESETSQRSEETERLRKLLKELQSLTITDWSWEILVDSFKKNIKKGLRKTKEKSSARRKLKYFQFNEVCKH